jgi:TPR repeat protein
VALNEPIAMTVLGALHMQGELVPRDPERGVSLLRRAARLGSADAQALLKKNNISW